MTVCWVLMCSFKLLCSNSGHIATRSSLLIWHCFHICNGEPQTPCPSGDRLSAKGQAVCSSNIKWCYVTLILLSPVIWLPISVLKPGLILIHLSFDKMAVKLQKIILSATSSVKIGLFRFVTRGHFGRQVLSSASVCVITGFDAGACWPLKGPLFSLLNPLYSHCIPPHSTYWSGRVLQAISSIMICVCVSITCLSVRKLRTRSS